MTPHTRSISFPLERQPWSDGNTIIEVLRRNGHDGFFVGGCVRDALIGRGIKDVDIATSAHPEQVEACFPKTVAVGRQFGVVIVVMPSGANIEVATFRNDGAYIDGRRPATVRYSTAEEDVNRRDFTVNSLLYEPSAGKVIDYVGGLGDLEMKRVRAVGDAARRLTEDRLRVLRALRFAAQLDFSIEEATWAAIADTTLVGLSAERLMDEWFKGLAGEHPSRWFELIVQSGRMPEFCPPLSSTTRHEGLSRIESGDAREVAAALWLSPAPLSDALAWLERQPLAKNLATDIAWLLTHARAAGGFMQLPLADQRRRMQHAQAGNLARLCDLMAHDAAAAIREAFATERRNGPFQPLVRANDLIALGFAPGPALGKALKHLEEAQLEGRIHSIDDARALAQTLSKS